MTKQHSICKRHQHAISTIRQPEAGLPLSQFSTSPLSKRQEAKACLMMAKTVSYMCMWSLNRSSELFGCFTPDLKLFLCDLGDVFPECLLKSVHLLPLLHKLYHRETWVDLTHVCLNFPSSSTPIPCLYFTVTFLFYIWTDSMLFMPPFTGFVKFCEIYIQRSEEVER